MKKNFDLKKFLKKEKSKSQKEIEVTISVTYSNTIKTTIPKSWNLPEGEITGNQLNILKNKLSLPIKVNEKSSWNIDDLYMYNETK